MSFLRPKSQQAQDSTTPSPLASPTDALNSMARLRRVSGGRNSFAPAQSTPSALRPASVTGVPG